MRRRQEQHEELVAELRSNQKKLESREKVVNEENKVLRSKLTEAEGQIHRFYFEKNEWLGEQESKERMAMAELGKRERENGEEKGKLVAQLQTKSEELLKTTETINNLGELFR